MCAPPPPPPPSTPTEGPECPLPTTGKGTVFEHGTEGDRRTATQIAPDRHSPAERQKEIKVSKNCFSCVCVHKKGGEKGENRQVEGGGGDQQPFSLLCVCCVCRVNMGVFTRQLCEPYEPFNHFNLFEPLWKL